MPSIDQLAPATSASDSDEFIINQGGVVKKVTRAQVLAGVQPQIALPANALLGRAVTGTGAPQPISVGRNLALNAGTLSATASQFEIAELPAGTVPAGADLVAVSQAGTNVAIGYAAFISGISAVPNVDFSLGLVTPAGASSAQTLAALAANTLPVSGGTLTGALSLASTPVIANQAANKAYVDHQISLSLPLTGGSLTGALTLTSGPVRPLDAATKGYADAIAANALPLSGGSLSGVLTLKADPVNTLQAATKHYADLKLARTGDTLTGPLVLATAPTSSLQAATKGYVDSQVGAAMPKSGGTLTGSLILASDPTSSAQASTKNYVDQRVMRDGDTLTGALTLAADPVSPGQAATKNYIDSRFGTTVLRSGSSMTGSLLLASDPGAPLQASTKQYVDLRISRNGDTMTGALSLAADPAVAAQAATKRYVDNRVATTASVTGATFSGPVSLAADPVAPAQAATKRYADTRLFRTGDTLTGALVLAADPAAPLQAATKRYVDATALASMPVSGGSMTGILTLAANPVAAFQAATKIYVDTQVGTALPLTGGTVMGTLSLAALPAAPAQAATKQYVDSQVATALPLTGGTIAGTLSLVTAPVLAQHAANKAYVDANPNAEGVINVALPPYSAKLDGVTDDTSAFKAAYLAAHAGSSIYVPAGTTVVQLPANWGIALTKRVKWIVDGTVLADGTPLASAVPTGGGSVSFALPGFVTGSTPTGLSNSQSGSQTTDFCVNQSSYIVNHAGGSSTNVISNSRTDTLIYNSPANYVWGGLDRLIWAGTQTPTANAPAQHVGRYIQTIRETVGTSADNVPLPQPQLWTACLEFRDASGQPSSATNASLTVEMDWYGNGKDDANTRAIQSLVLGQHNTAGPAVEVCAIIGAYLAAGSTGSAKTVFAAGLPFSNAVLDTTNAQSINGAPAIKLAAGHSIAFEASNSNKLSYDSATGTLRWIQNNLSYAVGKGISVGWQDVYSASAILPNYIAGNIIFLTGTTNYTITLPKASTVAAGTGYTFSVLGTASVNIAPSGVDMIDCGPITLHTNDRYHIVSDGTSFWREVFKSNSVSPRFSGPIVLQSYTVAALPTSVVAGSKVFATNGLKPSETAGAGTGVEVFFDGQHWISSCSGTVVAA